MLVREKVISFFAAVLFIAAFLLAFAAMNKRSSDRPIEREFARIDLTRDKAPEIVDRAPEPEEKVPPPEMEVVIRKPVQAALPTSTSLRISPGIRGLDSSAYAALVMSELSGTGDATIFSAEEVDIPPQALTERNSKPPYPVRATRNEIEGSVTVRLLVSDSGAVEDVNVIDASPRGYFESTVTGTLDSWRFEPAVFRGEKIRCYVVTTIKFNLENQ
ncbi:MAG: energy transducer TonB [Planctomycetes bacterium]|nr:energy transducer TonB [Planctomycetota bacterium]